MTRRLAIFDCDGTLVDSQHGIVSAMGVAFATEGMEVPTRAAILSIIGLSLEGAMARLAPDADAARVAALCKAYRAHNGGVRISGRAFDPIYEGMAELLDALEAEGWLLAVATGKSDRGLAHVLECHGLTGRFVSLQTADRHPSKPHPSMIEAALADAGADRANAVMIGDTSFDMLMGQAAGVRALGVGWGYHGVDELVASGADAVAMDSAQLAHHIGLR